MYVYVYGSDKAACMCMRMCTHIPCTAYYCPPSPACSPYPYCCFQLLSRMIRCCRRERVKSDQGTGPGGGYGKRPVCVCVYV
ncbi:hypothetical protein EON63_24135 [archaeon]|nr:MAG: hypothetical protein EON63_24135 [archaeon]